MRETERRAARLLRRQRDLGARRAAPLVRPFADPEVAYVCGRLRIEHADGSNREGVYWRYELAVRGAESRLGSVTGGNGSIYAVRRSDYVEVDPRFGHDLSLPYLMVQHGRRAVYEPSAVASEKPTPSNETEYRRKVRMFEHCWLIVLRGRMLRRQPPLYWLAARLAPAPALRAAGCCTWCCSRRASRSSARAGSTTSCSPRRSSCSRRPRSASGSPATTCSSRWATLVSLWNYLRRGVPATWATGEEARGAAAVDAPADRRLPRAGGGVRPLVARRRARGAAAAASGEALLDWLTRIGVGAVAVSLALFALGRAGVFDRGSSSR